MIKKIFLKHTIIIILSSVALGIIAPFYDGYNFERALAAYKTADHWIITFVAVTVTYLIWLYFTKINPRKFYYCVGSSLSASVLVTVALSWFVIAILIAIIENIFLQIIVLILSLLVTSFIVYATIFRAIGVYKNGKIRIFKFKIKTYPDGKIEKIKFDYSGKKCVITIIVDGETSTFKLSKSSADKLKLKKEAFFLVEGYLETEK